MQLHFLYVIAPMCKDTCLISRPYYCPAHSLLSPRSGDGEGEGRQGPPTSLPFSCATRLNPFN